MTEDRTPITTIVIRGGLPPGSAPPFARAVDPTGRPLNWVREPGEPNDAFHARGQAEAEAAGCEVLTFGGLPIHPRGE